MALKKKHKQSNGVELGYHRIAMIKHEVNQRTTMLVISYVDESGRQYEKDCAEGKVDGEPTLPYTSAEFISLEYDESMDVKKAYKWLKKQAKFEGAEDA